MTLTPYLKLTPLTVGQTNKETSVNNSDQRIEQATQKFLAVSMAGGDVTLTADQFTQNFFFKCSGSASTRNLIVPLTVDGAATPVNRFFLVENADTNTLTVKGSTGLTVILAINDVAWLKCDGVDVTLISKAANVGIPYDIATFFPGKPPASNALMWRLVAVRAFTIKSGTGTDKQGYSGTNATASTVLTMKKNGSSIGTFTFTSGGHTATIGTFSSDTSFAVGDQLEFFGDTAQDTTLADVSISVVAYR
jgi:hypothetical protein